MDDEWLRLAMVLPALDHSPIAASIWDSKVLPAIGRHPRFHRRLVASLRFLRPQSPGGLYLEPAPAMPFNRVRMDRAIARIIRGLAWHEYAWSMPSDLGFFIAAGPARDDLTKRLARDLLAGAPLIRIGGGAFEYLHSRTIDDDHGSAWFIRFYGVVNFLVLTDRRFISM